jgi:acyl-coenzyme A synthetase/AMP-(fatty) acid ligase
MPVEQKRRLMALLPNAWIVNNYGLTEAMRTCLHPMRETPHKLATVGRPSPTVSIKIVDENDRELPVGALGEVCIAGGNLASGYWQNDRMWHRKFRDGWYHTEDLGSMDEDGYLTLQGRADHAINSGGKTIALSEIEDRLRPLVRHTTFAACGMNDPKGILGEIVILCVEGEWKESAPWKDFRIGMFEVLSPSMVPKEAFLVPLFPRTSNGKIQLGKMRERLEAGEFPRV